MWPGRLPGQSSRRLCPPAPTDSPPQPRLCPVACGEHCKTLAWPCWLPSRWARGCDAGAEASGGPGGGPRRTRASCNGSGGQRGRRVAPTCTHSHPRTHTHTQMYTQTITRTYTHSIHTHSPACTHRPTHTNECLELGHCDLEMGEHILGGLSPGPSVSWGPACPARPTSGLSYAPVPMPPPSAPSQLCLVSQRYPLCPGRMPLNPGQAWGTPSCPTHGHGLWLERAGRAAPSSPGTPLCSLSHPGPPSSPDSSP